MILNNIKNILKLPYFSVKFSYDLPQHKILVLTGGCEGVLDYIKNLLEDSKIIISVDKGIDTLKKINILPNLLIGDFDSANEKALLWAKEKKIPILKYPKKKDFTDTQLALDMISSKYKDSAFVIVSNCFGGRFDHLYSLIMSMNLVRGSSNKILGCLTDGIENLFFLEEDDFMEFTFSKKPRVISVLPLSDICEKVSIKGTFWELDEEDLKKDFPYSISNILRDKENTIKISQKKGKLAIYILYD